MCEPEAILVVSAYNGFVWPRFSSEISSCKLPDFFFVFVFYCKNLTFFFCARLYLSKSHKNRRKAM